MHQGRKKNQYAVKGIIVCDVKTHFQNLKQIILLTGNEWFSAFGCSIPAFPPAKLKEIWHPFNQVYLTLACTRNYPTHQNRILWKIGDAIIINLKTLQQTLNFMPWKTI